MFTFQNKDDTAGGDKSLAFQLLLLHSGFQLFVEPTSAAEVLQVRECTGRIFFRYGEKGNIFSVSFSL
jgi:hypothetical protein